MRVLKSLVTSFLIITVFCIFFLFLLLSIPVVKDVEEKIYTGDSIVDLSPLKIREEDNNEVVGYIEWAGERKWFKLRPCVSPSSINKEVNKTFHIPYA